MHQLMSKPMTPHLDRLEAEARIHSHTPNNLTYCFARDVYSELFRLLAAHGRFRITLDEGWRLYGFWPELDPLTAPAAAPRPSGPTSPVCPTLRN